MTDLAAVDLHDRFASDVPELVVASDAAPVEQAHVVVLDDELAADLGLDAAWLRSEAGLGLLTGADVPSSVRPVAMAYAGHQFGNYNPRLGDGRALLLGELRTPEGALVDLHLKGSGRTPFARGGDGLATLGPMLREFLMARAMAALGIPTTRSLAVVTTGAMVARQRMEPGAILTRVAASHLRVGTFQYTRQLDDLDVLRRLLDHAIERHHPAAADTDRPALALLDHVIAGQADLVAKWMGVGFIHGVMNTDNMAISGEGIDYGPCAFMDHYDLATVYSSIDHGGRYAYGNQPGIAQWNLTRLAESLLPLIDDDHDTAVALATESLQRFVARFQAATTDTLAAKLGLDPAADGIGEVIESFLSLLQHAGPDYTNTFRALSSSLRGDHESLVAQFPEHPGELDEWRRTWGEALGDVDLDAVADAMDAVNPVYVPRNHLVEEALDAAVLRNDLLPFETLVDLVTNPYEPRPGHDRYAEPAPTEFDQRYQTFCGT